MIRVVANADLHAYVREGVLTTFKIITLKDGQALSSILGSGCLLGATSGRARAVDPVVCDCHTTVVAALPPRTYPLPQLRDRTAPRR